jgi:hypothetical protein
VLHTKLAHTHCRAPPPFPPPPRPTQAPAAAEDWGTPEQPMPKSGAQIPRPGGIPIKAGDAPQDFELATVNAVAKNEGKPIDEETQRAVRRAVANKVIVSDVDVSFAA